MDPDRIVRPEVVLWVLEHLWARGRTDVLQDVDLTRWPELDCSRPLSLDDTLSLRLASAKAYCIVKNGDLWRFETVMSFLEATHKLLPELVAPIKHMKIMFGLKTMIIIGMLKERRSMVDTVFKANQFFPNKLLQYQDQCTPQEMFLMRKNHMDFKALTQVLAMDKDKLEDYMKNDVEQQYGQHYARKVQDRLFRYLCELELALPRETYISRLLKMDRPMTDEERHLLHMTDCDCSKLPEAVHMLLHADVGYSDPAQHEPEQKNTLLHVDPSKALPRPTGDAATRDVSKDSPLLFDNEESEVGRLHPTEEDREVSSMVEEEPKYDPLRMSQDNDGELNNVAASKEESQDHVSEVERKVETQNAERTSVQDVAPSPQFCCRHERWVKSILRECTDECSEELLLNKSTSVSPSLFQSSSSASSSQDLTPSDLIPCPSVQQLPPPQTSFHPQVSTQVSEEGNSKDKLRSGSAVPRSQSEPLPQQCSFLLVSPLVRLVDIVSVRRGYREYKPHQASPSNFTISTNEHTSTSNAATQTSPPCHNPTKKESVTSTRPVSPSKQTNTTDTLYTLPVAHIPAVSAYYQPPATRSSSRLPQKLRQFSSNTHPESPDPHSQKPSHEYFGEVPPTVQMTSPPSPSDSDAFESPSQVSPCDPTTPVSVCSGQQTSLCTNASSGKVHQVIGVPQAINSVRSHAHTYNLSPSEPQTSNSPSVSLSTQACRTHRTMLRLSLQSRAVLQQPSVSLTRLDPRSLQSQAVLPQPPVGLTGLDPRSLQSQAVLPQQSVNLTGLDPRSLQSQAVLQQPSVSLTRLDPQSLQSRAVLQQPSVSLTGLDPRSLRSRAVLLQPSLSLTGLDPQSLQSQAVLQQPSVSLTGLYRRSLRSQAVLQQPSLSLTGLDPRSLRSRAELPQPSLSLTGLDRRSLRSLAELPQPSLSLTGLDRRSLRSQAVLQQPSVNLTGRSRRSLRSRAELPQPSLSLTGLDPRSLRSRAELPQPSLSLTGLDPQSLRSQAVLQQPSVNLTGLDRQNLQMATTTRSAVPSIMLLDEEDTEESLLESSFEFDVNSLYSSPSSGSDCEDSRYKDPDYKPHIKKQRLMESLNFM